MNRRWLKLYLAATSGSGLDQHPDRRRSGVPDGDLLVLRDPVPVLGIELRLVDDRRHPCSSGAMMP